MSQLALDFSAAFESKIPTGNQCRGGCGASLESVRVEAMSGGMVDIFPGAVRSDAGIFCHECWGKS